jgi:hypothetical protein
MTPSSEFVHLRDGVNNILKDLGNLLGELIERPATDRGFPEVTSADEENAQALIDVQLNIFFSTYRSLKKRHDDECLSLAVLALTKSGKNVLRIQYVNLS